MAVNKAELYTSVVQVNPDASTPENNFNIGKLTIENPFKTNGELEAPVVESGNLLFGSEIVDVKENALSTTPDVSVSSASNPLKAIRYSLVNYLRQVQNWDRTVDPAAALVISHNIPNYENIKLAVLSNPRLLSLAQQANR